MRQIQGVIREINEMRQFACFGTEPFFESVHDVQYQRKNRSLISLKEAVKGRVGMDIDKSETMSDWTREVLTINQILYAAMDALAVHYIWSGRSWLNTISTISTASAEHQVSLSPTVLRRPSISPPPLQSLRLPYRTPTPLCSLIFYV
ncbi:hypothetical protein GCK72_002784 [Caenorhabditis remanei]|uniref:3'-5' exonuclease domain-containing protein n=1 Tax=Caenorhabditis remanei TaxID=31234 RepID=A0A6A5HRZ0_CAERE|nr:hypothetical protein GCK72_002784 [Caenorhabditis remanei]KAF1770960.1 hypothetical protein GCK72_002784 [Caenorhabditis remanei]